MSDEEGRYTVSNRSKLRWFVSTPNAVYNYDVSLASLVWIVLSLLPIPIWKSFLGIDNKDITMISLFTINNFLFSFPMKWKFQERWKCVLCSSLTPTASLCQTLWRPKIVTSHEIASTQTNHTHVWACLTASLGFLWGALLVNYFEVQVFQIYQHNLFFLINLLRWHWFVKIT